MSPAAALVLASAATLVVGAALFACTRDAARGAERSWMIDLARALLLGRLRHLPPEQFDRYREECEADLDQLHDDPRAALIHALQAAVGVSGLRRMFEGAAPRRSDPPARRVLAHLGFPVRLHDAREDANASYIFDGAMRR